MTALSRVKAACCRLESRGGVGTGYLVGPREIATCAHVVRGLSKGDVVKARFGDSGSPVIAATLLDASEASDCAVLALKEEREPGAWLDLGSVADEESWRAYGFPAFSAPLGVALTGLVMDPDAEIPERLRGLALFSPVLGSHPPASVGGFSGSPVLVGSRVVGHLSSVLGIANAMKQPHLGYAYAVPSSGVTTLLGRPSPVAPAQMLGASEATIVERSTLLHALQLAASGAEVDALLEEASRGGRIGATAAAVAAQVLLGLMLPDDALRVLANTPGTRALELRALALSLKGQHAQAQALSQSLAFSAESRGIEGGILKRRWLATRNPAFLRTAFQTYFEAWEATRDHYPGINAAACALYLDRPDQGRKIAEEIKAELTKVSRRDAWQEASLAEAYLLTGGVEAAREQYVAAAAALQGRARDVAVMSTQARRNLKYLKLNDDALADALPTPPGVAAFTGHRIGKRLPNESVGWVRERILEVIEEQRVQFGFCSAASGSDIVFIELLLERCAEVHVFLPFPAPDFCERSVVPAKSWVARFDQVMTKLGPNRITVLSDRAPPNVEDAQPYVMCNEAIMRAAHEKAQELATSPFLIAVLASTAEVENPDAGGAADAVQAWFSRGEQDVVKVDPAAAPPARSQAQPRGAVSLS
jgi:hypothetical protein